MASSTSSGSISSLVQNSVSGSEEGDLQALMDQRKRKRMISNRESARRSRMRKQKHLDDLTAQVAQLRKDNHQIMTRVGITTQHYVTVEAENSVLRAQAGELGRRLESLDEIIAFLNLNNNNNNNNNTGFGPGFGPGYGPDFAEPVDSFFMNPLSLSYLNQPIMASPDIIPY